MRRYKRVGSRHFWMLCFRFSAAKIRQKVAHPLANDGIERNGPAERIRISGFCHSQFVSVSWKDNRGVGWHSTRNPRVDDLDLASLEISPIARGNCGTMGTRNCGNLAIGAADCPTGGSSVSEDRCKLLSGGAVEWQYAVSEVIPNQGVDLSNQPVPAPPCRKDQGFAPQFGLSNRAQMKTGNILTPEPVQYGRSGQRPHQIRDDIGVDQDRGLNRSLAAQALDPDPAV
ncbi:MAG: hypothetical protein OXH79_02900 [Boseongicola sp.]|nr:hypothetical protein [Boseongicola sp.]